MPDKIEVTYATAYDPAENRTRYARSLGELEAVLEQLASDGSRVKAVLVLPRPAHFRGPGRLNCVVKSDSQRRL